MLIERTATCRELRTFALDVFGHARVGGEWSVVELARQSSLGVHTRVTRPLGAQLILEQGQLRIAAYVVHHDQHVTGTHLLAIAHLDLAHDAAFTVLHGLALKLHLDARARQ